MDNQIKGLRRRQGVFRMLGVLLTVVALALCVAVVARWIRPATGGYFEDDMWTFQIYGWRFIATYRLVYLALIGLMCCPWYLSRRALSGCQCEVRFLHIVKMSHTITLFVALTLFVCCCYPYGQWTLSDEIIDVAVEHPVDALVIGALAYLATSAWLMLARLGSTCAAHDASIPADVLARENGRNGWQFSMRALLWGLLAVCLAIGGITHVYRQRYNDLDRHMANEAQEQISEWRERMLSSSAAKKVEIASSDDVWDLVTGRGYPCLDLEDIRMTRSVKAQLRELTDAQVLTFGGLTPGDLGFIGELTQVRVLSLRYSRLQGADLTDLAHLASLQVLNLSNTGISAEDLATLPALPSLELLYLDDGKVTDDHMAALCSARLPTLRALDLGGSSVTDRGISQLCATYHLEYLDVFHVRGITAESVDALSNMKTLKILALGGSGLSPDYSRTPAVAALKERLPKCRIDYGD